MTDDNVSKGLNQVSVTGVPYHAVVQPNSIETIITRLPTGRNGIYETWKYSRYFDNPQFWSIPGRENQFTVRGPVTTKFNIGCYFDTPTKTQPVPEQYEMYNLTKDPLEIQNLGNIAHINPYTMEINRILNRLLQEQSRKKRLYPTNDYGTL